MANESGNGNGRTKWNDKTRFEKFYSIAQKLAIVGTAVVASLSWCESVVAKRRANKSPEENVASAAHNELVKKVNNLAQDISNKEEELRKYLIRSMRFMARRVAESKSESKACQSLFIGHALAGIRRPQVLQQKLSDLTKTIAEQEVKASSPKIEKPKKHPNRFIKVRSYLNVKNAVQQKLKQAPPSRK